MLRTSLMVDNRDANEMFEYLEARIETLKRRIVELERNNETLSHALHDACPAALKAIQASS